MKVGDVCSRDVICIDGEADIIAAARRMRAYHVGALVVVDERKDPRAPIGILTDRDLVITVLAEDAEDMNRLLVGDVMTADPVAIRLDDDLDTAIDRMRAAGARRLPVVDQDGRLSGLLSFDDLADALARQLSRMASVLQTEQSREWQRRG